MAQQLLTALTAGKNIRAKIQGRTVEDPSLFPGWHSKQSTPNFSLRWYESILEAMADGWKLLAPPQWSADEEGWDWWLVRDVEPAREVE